MQSSVANVLSGRGSVIKSEAEKGIRERACVTLYFIVDVAASLTLVIYCCKDTSTF